MFPFSGSACTCHTRVPIQSTKVVRSFTWWRTIPGGLPVPLSPFWAMPLMASPSSSSTMDALPSDLLSPCEYPHYSLLSRHSLLILMDLIFSQFHEKCCKRAAFFEISWIWNIWIPPSHVTHNLAGYKCLGWRFSFWTWKMFFPNCCIKYNAILIPGLLSSGGFLYYLLISRVLKCYNHVSWAGLVHHFAGYSKGLFSLET